jgi:hypothetical protein
MDDYDTSQTELAELATLVVNVIKKNKHSERELYLRLLAPLIEVYTERTGFETMDRFDDHSLEDGYQCVYYIVKYDSSPSLKAHITKLREEGMTIVDAFKNIHAPMIQSDTPLDQRTWVEGVLCSGNMRIYRVMHDGERIPIIDYENTPAAMKPWKGTCDDKLPKLPGDSGTVFVTVTDDLIPRAVFDGSLNTEQKDALISKLVENSADQDMVEFFNMNLDNTGRFELSREYVQQLLDYKILSCASFYSGTNSILTHDMFQCHMNATEYHRFVISPHKTKDGCLTKTPNVKFPKPRCVDGDMFGQIEMKCLELLSKTKDKDSYGPIPRTPLIPMNCMDTASSDESDDDDIFSAMGHG